MTTPADIQDSPHSGRRERNRGLILETVFTLEPGADGEGERKRGLHLLWSREETAGAAGSDPPEAGSRLEYQTEESRLELLKAWEPEMDFSYDA